MKPSKRDFEIVIYDLDLIILAYVRIEVPRNASSAKITAEGQNAFGRWCKTHKRNDVTWEFVPE